MSLSTGQSGTDTPAAAPAAYGLRRVLPRARDVVGERWRDSAAWTVFALGCVVALVRVQSVSLDADEAATVSATDRSWGELWAMLHNIDAVHGLYYAGMKPWTALFGTSDVALRVPSALAIGGTAVGVLVLGRRLADHRSAFASALLVSVLPVSTWAGINARPFAFSALLAAWATVALLRAVDSPSLVRWSAYAAVSAVGVVENIYLVMLVAAHAVTLLLLPGRDRRAAAKGFVAAGVVVAAVALPVLWEVHSQQDQIGDDGTRDPLAIARKIFVKQFFLGVTPATDSTPIWFTYLWKASAAVAACVAFALVARLLWGERRRRPSPVVAVALPWILVPTAVVAAYAVLVSPIYHPHYFTFTAPALALLLGVALCRLNARRRLVVATLLLASFLAVYISQRVTYAKSGYDWSTAAAILTARAAPGDAVYFTPRFLTDDPYDNVPARRLAVAYPGAFSGLTDLTARVSGAESATLDGWSVRIDSVRDQLAAHPRVWMVYGVDYPTSLVAHGQEVIEAAGFTPRYRWAGPRFGLVEYVRTPGR